MTFDEKYRELLETSTYYKSNLHRGKCRICKLPEKIKNHINEMILYGDSYNVIRTYLMEQHGNIFDEHRATRVCIKSHAEYLPLLLDDVQIKTIFKRARYILENNNIDDLEPDEKAKVISDVEKELIKEYENIENDKQSVLAVLFKETIPLMMTRLNKTIIDGKPKEILDISNAGNIMLKMGTALTSYVEKEDSNLDYIKESSDVNENVLSLTEKIAKSTKNRQNKVV